MSKFFYVLLQREVLHHYFDRNAFHENALILLFIYSLIMTNSPLNNYRKTCFITINFFMYYDEAY